MDESKPLPGVQDIGGGTVVSGVNVNVDPGDETFGRPKLKWVWMDSSSDPGQGRTLVHFSAQPEPYLTRNTPFKRPTSPNIPPTPPKHPQNNP